LNSQKEKSACLLLKETGKYRFNVKLKYVYMHTHTLMFL